MFKLCSVVALCFLVIACKSDNKNSDISKNERLKSERPKINAPKIERPKIAEVQSSGTNDRVYLLNEFIELLVIFDQNVNVHLKAGTPPQIQLAIGDLERYATYVSGTGTSTLVFRYLVSANDGQTQEIHVRGNIRPNGSSISNSEGLNAVLTMDSITIKGVDTVPPSISFTSPVTGSLVSQNSLELVGTCEGELSMTFRGDIKNSPRTLPCSAGSFQHSVSLTSGNGLKTINATQGDEVGNLGQATLQLAIENSPPTLKLTPGNRLARLNWNGLSGATRYQYRKSTTSGSFNNNDNPWIDIPGEDRVNEIIITNLIGDTTYYFQVRALYQEVMGGASVEASGTPSAPEGDLSTCRSSINGVLPGSGTAMNPFILCSRNHLELIGNTTRNPNYTLSAVYAMGTDIDMTNQNWTPVSGSFTGTLRGRGKKIYNLKINSQQAALFLELGPGGTIENLGIEELDILGSQAAGLVVNNFGTITNCHVVDSDPSHDLRYLRSPVTNPTVGGLVANQRGGIITSSYVTGGVYMDTPKLSQGSSRAGGLVGYQEGGHITSSYATGTVSSLIRSTISSRSVIGAVGGLVGYQKEGHILSSYAISAVSPSAVNYVELCAGGLVGYQEGGRITSSYATGAISTIADHFSSVGGLAGYQKGHITSSYATGAISPFSHFRNSRFYVGGLVGHQDGGHVTSSYATGKSSPNPLESSFTGTLVGHQSTGQITSSYGFGTVTGKTITRSTLPEGVTKAGDLTQVNSGTSTENRWSQNAWDFGSDSQLPALKYVDNYEEGDHDENTDTPDTWDYRCSSTSAFLPSISITCGTTLLPNQGR